MIEGKPAPEQDPKTGRFVSGNIGGPGKPHGSRNKLGEEFIRALHDSFTEHGADTIEQVRIEKPDQYLKVIASLLPKELNVKVSELDELTDEQIARQLAAVAAQLAANGYILGEGVGQAPAPQPAGELQTLQ